MKKTVRRVLPCLVALVAGAGADGASAQTSEPSPRITAIWGEPRGGEELRIVGSGFGTHPLEIDSGVGPRGWIELNGPGTPTDRADGAENWSTFATKVAAKLDTLEAHSGRQAVNASIDRAWDDDWNKILLYTHPRPFQVIYASWWIYFEPVRYADPTQWKMWRVSDAAGNLVASDNCAAIYMTSAWSPVRDSPNFSTEVHCQKGCQWPAQIGCFEHIRPEPFYEPLEGSPFNYQYHSRGGTEEFKDNLPIPGEWCRLEVFLRASDMDEPNGEYWFALLRPGETRRVIEHWKTGLMTHRSDCCEDFSGPWKHFVLQGYFDDNGGPFADEVARLFYDDIYLQFGTQARVELGDAPVYGDCQQLAVQEVTSWQDDELVIRYANGGLSGDDASWLFVVDGSGAVSEGFPTRQR